MPQSRSGYAILGLCLILGLSSLGYLLGNAALQFKAFERTVTVKGLSEREFPSDVVIWPIQFAVASNDLTDLYQSIDDNSERILAFLLLSGISESEISFSSPAITDESAQQYGNQARAQFRYTALQTVTVYSSEIETVRRVMANLSELGKQGIAITGGDYQSQTEYLFTRLNDVKPEMIEEATQKARVVAEKFASDSQSSLGKIKTASQGRFTIEPRDRNNPHVKKVRVVSTITYYLAD
jgi:hypothetical protein